MNIASALYEDEAGFIVSAELVLVATICVIGMVVGLSEVAWGVNEELEDTGSAIGSVNQSFAYRGASGYKGIVAGSYYGDNYDMCDSQYDVSCDVYPTKERYGHNHDGYDD